MWVVHHVLISTYVSSFKAHNPFTMEYMVLIQLESILHLSGGKTSSLLLLYMNIRVQVNVFKSDKHSRNTTNEARRPSLKIKAKYS